LIDSRWHGLVKGLPDPLVKGGFVDVSDRPGMGVELNEKAVRGALKEGEAYFE
jgi:L-alanine-DL-glutamate epimerase-like enolase superfamily enzyme